MITPDFCTGGMGCNPPKKHCKGCSHAIFTGTLNVPGIFKEFEFNPQYGVFFIGKDGEEMHRQPGERNKKAWDAWGKWYDERFKK